MNATPTVRLPPAVLRVPALSLYRLLDRLTGEDPRKNPWLEGNFAPVRQEVTADDLPVMGQVPAPVCGFYLRNGANPRFLPKSGHHWFDGDGMIHGLRLWPDRARYVNRFVRTRRLAVEEAYGQPVFGRLGEIQGKVGLLRVLVDRLRQWIGAMPPDDLSTGTANTSLLAWRGEILALNEASWPYRLRATRAGELLNEGFASPPFPGAPAMPLSAHPRLDPETGELRFLSYHLMGPPAATHLRVGPDGAVRGQVPLSLSPPPMIHDFAITPRYSLLPDLPFVFDVSGMFKGDGSVFQFRPERPSRLGLLPRLASSEAEVRWFPVQPGFVFHWCNAWEEGDDVVAVGCRMRRFSMLQTAEQRPTLWRWRLCADGRVEEGPLCDLEADFPQIHPDRTGQAAEVCWLSTVIQHRDRLPRMRGVARVNLKTGAIEGSFTHGDEVFGGELSFVPAPGGRERQGWLVGFVHDEHTGRSALRVYDAETLHPEPVAEVQLPGRVPYGFHGVFVPEADLA